LRRAVVTGASRGIGRAVAERLCREGFRVVGVGRDVDALRAAERGLGECFRGLVYDLSDPTSWGRLVEEAVGILGGVDLLVNNAGFGVYRPVLGHSLDELMSLAVVNFVAPIALTKLFLDHIPRGGAVVFVITAGIHVLMSRLPVYGASKIALHYAVKALREELKPRGIKVVAVYPGGVLTEFHRRGGGEPPRLSVTADRVAEAILKAVMQGSEEVYVPGYLRILKMLGPMLPKLF